MGIFSNLFKKKETTTEDVQKGKNESTEKEEKIESQGENNNPTLNEEPSSENNVIEEKQVPVQEQTPTQEIDIWERAKNLIEAEELYVLLSISKANMLEGFSFPYIGNLGEGKLTLYLFSTLDLAKQFVLGSDYEVLDGVYPIGKLEKKDQFSTLINTLIIAKKIMNVSHFDIDGVASYDIAEFLEKNEIKEYQVKIHLTNQEAEQAKASNGQNPPQLPRRFNPIRITNFHNRFAIPEERRKELSDSLFVKEGQTREECLNTYVNGQTLTENCFMLTILFLSFMPQAEKAKNETDLKYFAGIRHMLSMVIWMKLKAEKKLYTLVDPQTKKPIIHNESMCVLYTDRFKYIQGNCEYKELAGIEEIKQIVAENNLKSVVVDGITTTAVLDAEICK
ncbi:MAG: hypothetical protein J5554_10800 [Paludibacteraceae bacterium]|nr:hypothetical protein [Paludibacteraceae bacterium]